MSTSSNQGQVTQGPPAWVQQAAQQYLGAAGQAAAMPYQNYQGTRVAPFTPLQNQAFSAISGTMNGTPATQSANSALNSILSGGTNPYLDQVISRGRRGVTDAYNAATADTTRRFNEPGQWMGSAHLQATRDNQEALAQGLGDLESGLRYQDFTGNLNRQLQAAPLAMGLAQGQQGLAEGALRAGNLQQGYGQSLADSLYGDWRQAQDYPWTQIDRYGNALRASTGSSGQTSTTQEASNPWSSALGLGLLGYSLWPRG